MKNIQLCNLFEKPLSGEWGNEPTFENNTVEIIRSTNFSSDIRIKKDSEIVKRDIDYKKITSKKLQSGDIIIEKSGGSPSQPVGRILFYDPNDNETRLCNNFTSVLRTKKGNNPKFIAYLLFDLYKKGEVLKYQNKTTGIINLKLNDYLKSTIIPLPPLETQQKIVAILDKAQSLIDKRKEQLELMDKLVESVFYDMFGDPVKNEKGWETREVAKVCKKILGGGTPSKNKPDFYIGDIPWVTPKDMKRLYIDNSIDHINKVAIEKSSTKLIPNLSVLMVIRSGILKKHLPVAINTKEVTINQDMKAFVLNRSIVNPSFFLYFWIMSQRYLLSKVRAVTADNIEFRQIKEMQIILPTITLQEEFEQKVESIEKQKDQMQKSLLKMEEQFAGLMQRAFKGEIT